ncbi:neuroligin-4, Y-linked-like isoform X2 [Littorina saxatilis]|uniref:Carboxylic ester hydrolase n=1 Tax=Littorina saxatilis TaxID=31220 RepID=A0AAN9G3J9_9CAEN
MQDMDGRLLILFLQWSLCLSFATSATSAPIIVAPWGRLTGVDLVSTNGNRYHGYLGISYALPPVGERRWAAPEAHPGPGVGQVFNASSYGPLCPQPGAAVMSEDCLTLNIFVPASAQSQAGRNLRSVMIYIHGGSFTFGGAANLSPASLVTRGDVIVVVIQYRLGILGFLSSGDDAASGNYGLLDQNLAISWVKDNIRDFGGDPDSMTVFGQSSGASCAGYQMLSPHSKGLFRRAILQSGVPVASWALDADPLRGFYALAKEVGCYCEEEDKEQRSSNERHSSFGMWARRMFGMRGAAAAESLKSYWAYKRHVKTVECLRKLDASRLLPYTAISADREDFDLFQSFPYVPTVDGDFVPRHPSELLSDPHYLMENDVTSRDVMLGVNNEEGPLILTYVQSLNVAKNVTAFLLSEEYRKLAFQNELQFQYGKQLIHDQRRLSPVIDVLKFFYEDDKGNMSLKSVSDLFGDTAFISPVVRMARQLSEAKRESQQANGSTYLYLFDHYPANKAQQQWKGMAHSDDLNYEFDSGQFLSRSGFTQDDYRIADNFVDILTSFARTGNPTSATRGSWPEFSFPEEFFLSFGPQPRVDDHLYNKRVALWMDLIPSLINSTRAGIIQDRIAPLSGMQEERNMKPRTPKWPTLVRRGWPFAWPKPPMRRGAVWF